MKAARNIAIILALAVPIAFLPGGGNAAEAVITTLVLGFLTAIAFTLVTLHRRFSFDIDTLEDQRRAILYAALGLIALAVAGAGDMLATGGLATLALLAMVAAAIFMLVGVWREMRA